MKAAPMKAIEITDIKLDDNLRLIEVHQPKPSTNQALIKVNYASVNRPDLLQRKGLHPIPKGASLYPGLDIAGEIVAIGDDSDLSEYDCQIGDFVCALLPGGGYAEYAIADLDLCLPMPKNLSLAEAASLPECLFTVWNNLFLRGKLQKKDTVLIHGGSSGIGSFAIQMAKAQGARVITTAGNDQKCDACEALGADLVINYKTHDFEDVIKDNYGESCVNVVLDMVGGDYVPKHLNLMAPDGRHVNIAFLNGVKTEIDLSLIMKKRIIMTGSTLRTRPLSEKAALAKDLRDHVWPWLENGSVKPVIHEIYSLSDVSKAHDVMKKSDHIGKILLAIS
jgi:NADPH2:quinone reductase